MLLTDTDKDELKQLLCLLNDFVSGSKLYPNRPHKGQSLAQLVFRDSETTDLVCKWCNNLGVYDEWR